MPFSIGSIDWQSPLIANLPRNLFCKNLNVTYLRLTIKEVGLKWMYIHRMEITWPEGSLLYFVVTVCRQFWPANNAWLTLSILYPKIHLVHMQYLMHGHESQKCVQVQLQVRSNVRPCQLHTEKTHTVQESFETRTWNLLMCLWRHCFELPPKSLRVTPCDLRKPVHFADIECSDKRRVQREWE